MIFLGLLLILASAGLSLALIRSNASIFTAPVPVLDIFGNQIHATVGQVFIAGAVAAAVALLGLVMLVSALGRKAARRSTARHQLRSRRDEIQDLKRKRDATDREASDRAADHVGDDEENDSERIATRR